MLIFFSYILKIAKSIQIEINQNGDKRLQIFKFKYCERENSKNWE